MNRYIKILVCLILLVSDVGRAEALFLETFDNYDSRPNGYQRYFGLPEQGTTGSDELWYGARFFPSDHEEALAGISVLKAGGKGNSTPVGRVENMTGLLLKIDAGHQDISLSFDWRTYSVNRDDQFVAGYFLGDPGFDAAGTRFLNLYSDDSAAPTQWESEWTELMRGNNNRFTHETFSIPDAAGEDLWVAFWLDGEKGDYGKIDNILVDATLNPELVPEPTTATLIAFAALLAIACKSIFRRFTMRRSY
ncbi:MAG TPA: hypothetical protein VIR77_04180 [Pontiella sp.]